MVKYGLKTTPETTDETTEEGEGEEKTGAAYISASAAVVVLGALLQ